MIFLIRIVPATSEGKATHLVLALNFAVVLALLDWNQPYPETVGSSQPARDNQNNLRIRYSSDTFKIITLRHVVRVIKPGLSSLMHLDDYAIAESP